MTQLSEKILAEIEKEHIAPVPRWHFLVRNCVFWTLFAISIFLGSLAVSVMVEIYKIGDWDLLDHLQGNLFASAVMSLPYFWILFLFLFALIAFYNWKHTKKGYLLKRRWIFVGSVAGSIFLGSFMNVLGWGKEVDSLMIQAMPIYDRSKHAARNELWQQPEKGLIMGKIIEVAENGETLKLRDEKGRIWEIKNVLNCRKTSMEIEKEGKVIKVMGKKTGEKLFEANEIRKCGDCFDDEDKK